MKNVLLINFKRFGDIFYMAHTIHSIKEKYPNVSISVLVFEEFKKASKILKNIDRVYSIDRKKIVSYLKNQIYSDSFALNEFLDNIDELNQKTWDYVYNYSNDKVASYISSYLTTNTTAQPTGLYFNKYNTVQHSNNWSALFNEFIVRHQESPFNFAHVYSKIASTNFEYNQILAMSNKSHDRTVERNFNMLREKAGDDCRLVGIQVSASNPNKSLPKETIIETIRRFYQESQTIPILLSAPTEDDRKLVHEISGAFNNNVVTIECDFIAAVSVLKNLDVVITPDTSIKHLADLTKTPCVELSLSESPIFKQSSVNTRSIILTRPVYERSFSKDESDLTANANDLVCATRSILFNEGLSEISAEVSVFKQEKDTIGLYLKQVKGTSLPSRELTRYTSRFLIHQIFENSKVSINSEEVAKYSNDSLRKWVESQRKEVAINIKNLLGTLRSIKTFQEDNSKSEDFINSLDTLLAEADSYSLSGICISLFRGQVENLPRVSFKENIIRFEKYLYNLKGNLQNVLEVTKEVEECLKEKEVRTSRGSINV